MNTFLTDQEMRITQIAIQNSSHLPTEEYESLCNDDLKDIYDKTLADLVAAQKLVEQKLNG